MATCGRCGWKVRRGARHCAQCGYPVRWSPPPGVWLLLVLLCLATAAIMLAMLLAGCGPGRSSGVAASGPPVHFAGIDDRAERIVYVIDATGAEQPTWPYVQAELLASFNGLSPGQRFAVVFFGPGEPEAFAPDGRAGLAEPTPAAVRAARQFVLGGRRTGPPNEAAGRRAVAMAFELLGAPDAPRRPEPGGRGDLVVLLAQRRWNDRLDEWTRHLNTAGRVRIDTIGFLDPQTAPLLECIARGNGGQFRLIEAVDLGKRP